LFAAFGAGVGVSEVASTSVAVRGTGVRSYTAPTVAIRLRLRFSPLDSRVASLLDDAFAAALVAGRSASGRITMPLPSLDNTRMSPGSVGWWGRVA